MRKNVNLKKGRCDRTEFYMVAKKYMKLKRYCIDHFYFVFNVQIEEDVNRYIGKMLLDFFIQMVIYSTPIFRS